MLLTIKICTEIKIHDRFSPRGPIRPQDSLAGLSPQGSGWLAKELLLHIIITFILIVSSPVLFLNTKVMFFCPGASSLQLSFPHWLAQPAILWTQTDRHGNRSRTQMTDQTTRPLTSVLYYSPADKMMDSRYLVWLPNFTRINFANLHPYLVHRRPVLGSLPGLPTDSCSRIAHTPPLSVLCCVDTPHSLAL